ncbi:hypothetical protein HanPI659440_Chr14g0529441 [Helianthus annuus]|nr:hypothetical protein HanPI659440_Chr14g0529441 [Helianthus annuus]
MGFGASCIGLFELFHDHFHSFSNSCVNHSLENISVNFEVHNCSIIGMSRIINDVIDDCLIRVCHTRDLLPNTK